MGVSSQMAREAHRFAEYGAMTVLKVHRYRLVSDGGQAIAPTMLLPALSDAPGRRLLS
jgi:hypothetical protein